MKPIESGFHFPSIFLFSMRTIWIADAHRDGKQFIVRADEKVTAFVELQGRYTSLR
jgi:hypothetical protein